MKRRVLRGRVLLPAFLLALCAALLPSQAYAAPTKVSADNDYSVASCTFQLISTSPVTGLAKVRITANARPAGFANAFRILSTRMDCFIFDDQTNGDPAHVSVFNGAKTINQTEVALVPFDHLDLICAVSHTTLKSLSAADGGDCRST